MKGNREDITPALCRKLLRYDAATGKLFWLPRSAEFFSQGYWTAQASANRWNKLFAFKEAFTAIDVGGYRFGNIFQVPFKAHRVAWAIVHGEWPKYTIDHVDGNPVNNLMSNLRDVPQHINSRNIPIKKSNKSGTTGVRKTSCGKRWIGQIKINYKTRARRFDTFEEAKAWRDKMRRASGFTDRHG